MACMSTLVMTVPIKTNTSPTRNASADIVRDVKSKPVMISNWVNPLSPYRRFVTRNTTN